MADPVRISWELHSSADLLTTWNVFSDTDRFNRVAELGFTFEEAPDDRGAVARVGHMKKLGMSLSWDELPFQYSAPTWFRTRRLFHGGPAAEFTASLRLKEAPQGGTDILYAVEVVPRNALTAPVVAIELKTQTRSQLDRALSQLLADLDRQVTPADLAAPPLSPQAETLLTGALSELDDAVADRLGALLRHGPLREQDRLHPPRLARRWGLETEAVTEAMLQATRSGALALHWEILCPSCQAPKAAVPRDMKPGTQVHCGSCNISYDAAFPDSQVASFRPAPALREFELPVSCIGSPAHQRHILADRELPPGGSLELELDLPAGAYRLRTWPLRGTASLDVHEGALSTSLELSADDNALDPPLLRAEPGTRSLTVKSESSAPLRLVLETRERPAGLLTVGLLLQRHPGAAQLLPAGLLSDELRSWRGVAVAVRALTGEKLAGKLGRARLSWESSQGAVAVYATAAEALTDLLHLDRKLAVAGIAEGQVTELRAGESLVPVGQAPEAALKAMHSAAVGTIATPASLDADRIDGALDGAGLSRVNARTQPADGTSMHWIE
jgi:hypothetical protein